MTSVSGAESQSFTYDNNGNLTQDAVGTYAHTPANLIATATVAGGTAVYTYRYDGDQQRVLTLQPGGTTTYTLRGLGGVLSEFTEQGGQLSWTMDYVSLGSQLIAAVRPPAGGPTMLLTVGKTGSGSGTITSN